MRVKTERKKDRHPPSADGASKDGNQFQVAQIAHDPCFGKPEAHPGGGRHIGRPVRSWRQAGLHGYPVSHNGEIADTAGAAAAVAAILRRRFLKGLLALGEQKLARHAAVKVVPRQDLIQLPATQVPFRFDVAIGKCQQPALQGKMLTPAVKAAAAFNGTNQNRRQTAVTAGKDPFHERERRILPFEFQLALFEIAVELILEFGGLLSGYLRLPLEWRMRLGNEGADGNIDIAGNAAPFGLILDLTRQRRDLGNIVPSFTRKPDHEVELDQAPAGLVDCGSSGNQVSLGNPLVDDPPHPVAPRLRRQGKTGLANFFYFIDQLVRQAPDPKGREGYSHPILGIACHQFGHQRGYTGIIAGRKRQQRYFIIAGSFERFFYKAQNRFRRAFAQRTVDIPCLTKTAATGAAAGDFHRYPVMNRLHKRHDRRVRV